MTQNWNKWAYSQARMLPAELVSSDPRAIDALVRRDFGVRKGADVYRTASAATLNDIGTYPAAEIGDQPKWHERDTSNDVAAYVSDGQDGELYQITRGWSERTIEENRETARQETKAWLDDWRNSEFSHTFNSTELIFDLNPDQELRLAAAAARRSSDFTTSWYANDGTKVDFASKTAFEPFYHDAQMHIETGNDTYEAAVQQIDVATTTTQLDTILNGLPQAPGTVATRSTGPLGGPTADPTEMKPRVQG